MTPTDFVAALERAALPDVFNPWRDHCAVHDLDDAAERRRENLRLVLEQALEGGVTTMWVARDLGYRGGRRTGVPLTDEVHLASAGALFRDVALTRATHGPVVAERTAAVVWRVLEQVRQPVVLWNVFPFHPHEAGDPMSNRCHTRAEREATWPLLEALIGMIRPERIVAIGRDASMALADLGVTSFSVRHPSYGGQSEFIAGMQDLYALTDEPPLFAASAGRA
ncbi:uracil-DNA glycosylase [Caulobacter flavus]|uniref:Uracil-DNA glycosylase n=1 Tax=Caulobacter flavus TaxID=1679497 RepID=A0A2N5D3C6_9CAUL|nr:uracil-DNA glycosylase [Caulobacter flavus]AYV48964.1 uracil-DNA glycosylase [Caulobacter flavus]PLR20532.1 uracil-DNA glycosylase [Caulobacter flavus]